MEISEGDLRALHERIQDLRRAAEDVRAAGVKIPAVERNASRILGGIDMLERNISDLFEPADR